MSAKGRTVMVLLESLAGTKHKYVRLRPRADGPGESILFDPIVRENVLYKEIKKIRTIKDKKKTKS